MIGSIYSIITSIVGGIFKFNMSKLIDGAHAGWSSLFFNIYFFTKMGYVLFSMILGFYLLFAFIVRYSIEFITLPEGAKAFSEGRKEMSSAKWVLSTLIINGFIVLLITLHMTQNIYWLKLMSASWTNLVMKYRYKDTMDGETGDRIGDDSRHRDDDDESDD